MPRVCALQTPSYGVGHFCISSVVSAVNFWSYTLNETSPRQVNNGLLAGFHRLEVRYPLSRSGLSLGTTAPVLVLVSRQDSRHLS